jgi:hypothetical protein
MDRRERYSTDEEVLRLAMHALQSRIWTALPGIVQRIGNSGQTVDVQPTINGRMRSPDGSTASIQMPVLLDCPVLWQGGGGATFTFPIAVGDECLVVISSRCIDAWWDRGGMQDAPDIRMHNLSDGFALVGVRSRPRAFAVNAAGAELRSDDGSTFVRLNPTGQLVQVTAPGGISLNGVTIDASGNLHTSATITADTDVIAGGRSGRNHTHPTSSPNTGPPNP